LFAISLIIATHKRQTFSLKDFTTVLRIQDYWYRKQRQMSSASEPTVLMGGVQPCLTLIPRSKSDVDETELIEFTLKLRAGSDKNAPTYKRKVARFNGGSPAEWIEVLEALDEIFAQNALTSPQDRENTIRTILRGDSLTAFESSIHESRANPEQPGEQLRLTVEMVTTALQAVSHDVFPHRALCHQIRWMQRRMRKPAGMGIRQFVAAISQMNEKLIRFPGATPSDLFKAEQLVELAEFALPDSWRAKFDLAGYVPTNFDKYRLIAEGEQIERAAALAKTRKPKDKSSKNAGKTGSTKNNFARKGKGNGQHSANAGKVTTKHKGPSKAPDAGKNLSGNKFRKELYALSKSKDRVKVIDQFASILKKERAKAVKAKSNNKSKNAKKSQASSATSSDDSSDSDESVHVMDAEETKKARMRHVFNRLKAKAKAVKKRPVLMSTETDKDEPLEEEKAFIAKVSPADEKNPFDSTSEEESSSDEDDDMSDVESDTKKTT